MSNILVYNLNSVKEVRRLRAICDQCECCLLDHYCKKYGSDSLIFLINRCDKLREI